MPSHETASPLVRFLAAALAAFAIATGALAQPTGGPVVHSNRPPNQPGTPQPEAPAPLIDVNFAGGTVSQYCDAVRAAASPHVVNIIINEGVGGITLPPISLKRVTVEVAMNVLTMTGRRDLDTQLQMDRLDDQGSSAYVLRTIDSSGATFPSTIETSVHSLRPIVEPPPGMANTGDVALPVDTVMAAVTAALGTTDEDSGPKPALMLHRESLMLVCRASRSQQVVVDSVLNLLEQDMRTRRNKLTQRIDAANKARLDRITTDAEVKQAQVSVAKAENDYQEALHNLDLIQKRIDSGLSPQTDLSRAQGEVTATNMRLEEAKTQYEAAKSRAAVLAERQEAMTPPAVSPSTEPIVVVYNADDFAPFKDDILTVASNLLGDTGGKAQWTNNSLVVRADPGHQQAVKTFLITLRRVKANDPALAPAAIEAKPDLDDKPRP